MTSSRSKLRRIIGGTMLPKAILFDLDDTILSFDGAADMAWKDICGTFIKRMNPSFDDKDLLKSINRVRKWYWGDPERHKAGRMDMMKSRREIVKMALQELQYEDDKAACDMADCYTQLQNEYICLFPDSIHTLDKLKALGIRMALITNGPSEIQRGKINRFCLSGYFDFCLIEGEVGYGKPDTRVFEMALEKLKCSADEVWMVGDNLVWDVEAPQRIGIYAIWNNFRKEQLPKGSTIIPDRIIHSIAQLLE